MRKSAAGFTLYGVVIAILLFGFALHPLVSTLASNTRMATDRQERMDAERILRNEVAVLSAADPESVPSLRTYQADRTGRSSADGPYAVVTRRTVRCAIGSAPSDNAIEPPPAGCPTGGVVHDFSITVTFPRVAGTNEEGILTRQFAVGSSAPDGSPVATIP